MNYYIRLDDACEKRNIKNWNLIEELLDCYHIKPCVGIIPHCEDTMMDCYEYDTAFWEKVRVWEAKGWCIALHGYSHVCIANGGGINPVNLRSEFAGVPLEIQKEKIRRGVDELRKHEINPRVFFAPSHTFDENTLIALISCSNIRVVSDTIASKPYSLGEITFIPQQSGCVRKLLLNTVTFCYHPNTMHTSDFEYLEKFILKNRKFFKPFEPVQTERKLSCFDRLLKVLYFARR